MRRRQIAHRDRRIEARAEAARGDRADRFGRSRVGKQRRAFAHRRAALRPQADAAARRAVLKLRENLVRAGKAAGARAAVAAALLDRPFQRGLDRRGRGVDVVAVEAKPGLEPQAVARAKPDRQHVAVLEQRFRQPLGMLGRNRNLKAVLAGIARARDEAVDAGDLARAGIHEPHRGGVCAKFRQRRFGLRPLQRDQRAIGQRLDHADVGQMRAQMRLVGVLAGGVDHQEQMAAEIRHHQIVEDAAGIVGELGVALPSRRNRDDVLRHQPFQRQRRVLDLAGFRPQRDLAHMRDVEQAGAGAGMQVFPQHAGGVLHRHLIARERHHLAAAGDMQRVQRRAFQRGLGRRAQASRGPRGFRGRFPENPSKPHLSLCLRVLSRRRTPRGQSPRRLFPDAVKSRGPFA